MAGIVNANGLTARATLTAGLIFAAMTAAGAQQAAPYDTKLNRLAEVLGSVHYLTNLCAEPSDRWRDRMQQLLAVERPEPSRRAGLIAAFNRGYRGFGSVYTTCTDQARLSADRYVAEGQTLAAELVTTYGKQ